MCNRYAYVEYCVTLRASTYHTPVHAYNPGMWPRSRRLASRAASRPDASLQGKTLQSVVGLGLEHWHLWQWDDCNSHDNVHAVVNTWTILLQDTMLVWYMLSSFVSPCVCLSAYLSHAGIVSKRRMVVSHEQRHTIAQAWVLSCQRSRRNSDCPLAPPKRNFC